MTAQVSVIYFGQSAELTGLKGEEPVSVPTPISSRDLWELLQQRHPRLAVLRGHVVLAVSHQYVPVAEQLVVLRDGDEVAVVPPLSGGMSEQEDAFRLSRDPLSLQEVVDAVSSPSCGAISVFLGTTREDEVGSSRVVGLHYEAYESMLQSEFTKLCADLRGRWPSVKHICIHHRLGWVKVGEASVAMAVSSPHRHDGQQAIQHCINQLKARMPIWKKEVYDTQEESWKENLECPWSSAAILLREGSDEENKC